MSRLSRWLIVLAVGVLAGCAGTLTRHGAAGPTIAQTIDEQIAKDEAIPWARSRPLTWADFKGPAPHDAGAVAAETAYALINGAACTGSRFEYRVVAVFRPKDSWVRQAMLRTAADSVRALRHEQTHFDLSEVHARRQRRYFADLIAPCRLSTGDLAAAASRITRDEKAAQAQYDEETDHGRNLVQQARWDKDVAGQLVALAKYERY